MNEQTKIEITRQADFYRQNTLRCMALIDIHNETIKLKQDEIKQLESKENGIEKGISIVNDLYEDIGMKPITLEEIQKYYNDNKDEIKSKVMQVE